ncbi:hypothetical protein J7426_22920 [Tropicibacter sp. R16_0]|uniref:hypothetical protein n=1 Tax=Tropicibacter sp. R16_0 TaxID=2821102 RepID=UPI001ADBF50F|nr:hypothetical protein [Tropicibacter sp. R16_0]MBO9453133.1 hypothetical protein [Tropicibacter sp. R16_0]
MTRVVTLAFAAALWGSAVYASGTAGRGGDSNDGKLSDDPTKIVTKIGLRYTDYGSIFGSVAFGPVTKLNFVVSEDEQWRIGGSYLFDFGIVNVSASRQDFENGINQTQYAIGTFLPLVAMGIQPKGWLLFPAAGANYTEGSYGRADIDFAGTFDFEVASKGAYVGLLGLKQLSEKWVFKSGGVVSAGSNDYSGVSAGLGLTYTLTPKNSLSVVGTYTDNSFGERSLLGVSYTFEF